MKKETALKRINNAVAKRIPNENTFVKNYIADLVYMTFENLEMDSDSYEHTSTENLNFAIEINLYDEFDEILAEAKEKTSIIYGYKNRDELVGYYEVLFYDDDGKNKNHWLSGKQIQHFIDRDDAIKYIEQVRQWNAINFSQYLIKKVEK